MCFRYFSKNNIEKLAILIISIVNIIYFLSKNLFKLHFKTHNVFFPPKFVIFKKSDLDLFIILISLVLSTL